MLCENCKSTLTEAAASGVTPAALRAHLDSCAPCRAALAEEQSLFAAVDAGLALVANTETPPSLLPLVRAAIDSRPAPTGIRVRGWSWIALGVSAALLVVLAPWLRRPPRHEVELAPPAPVAPVFRAADNASASSPASRRATVPSRAREAEPAGPRVIFPVEEREAYLRFVAAVATHNELARSLAASAGVKKEDESIGSDPPGIAALEIKPLESVATESQTEKDMQ